MQKVIFRIDCFKDTGLGHLMRCIGIAEHLKSSLCIFFIKGEGKAVLMNHGEYFSVYSGLEEVSVKVGDKVLAKEKIGIVFSIFTK